MQNNAVQVFDYRQPVAVLHKGNVIDRGHVVGRTFDKPEDTRYDIQTKEHPHILVNVAPHNMRRL